MKINKNEPFTEAKWIGGDTESVSPFITRNFDAKEVRKATLWVTSLGFFEAKMKGQAVSEEKFVPVVSDYEPRQLEQFLYPLHDETTFEWQKEMSGSKIIHWNNGLWDVCDIYGDGFFTSENEYVEYMIKVADKLIERYEKIIFATTTPVTKENSHRTNKDIKRYNDLIVPILTQKGIIINDLYETVEKDIDKYIRKDDNIHLTEDGIDVCAKQVADIILKTAEEICDGKFY